MLRLVAAIAVALVLSGPAAAAGIQGTYTTTVSGAAQQFLNGPWRISFAGGAESIYQFGTKVVSGHYAVVDNRVTISHESRQYSCGAKPAVYRWSLRGKLLTLVPVSETCAGRKLILTAHPLHKIR